MNSAFQSINRGYDYVFKNNHLSVGLVVPIENYDGSPEPNMQRHIERVQLAESLGFKAVWLRDVPFNVPSFGDAGQLYDPFVYLGFLAAQSRKIALGVSSIILPLRHPAHVAKAAATADVFSDGRLILGIASGDRAEEYPSLNMSYHDRGERFRESYHYIRQMAHDNPLFHNAHGTLNGSIDMLPKPTGSQIPLLITGGSQQSPQWLAQHGDGWMVYPRQALAQVKVIDAWRKCIKDNARPPKPLMEPLYVDLVDDPHMSPQPIHLGLRLGIDHLKKYLKSRQDIGVNHIAMNLRFNQADIETTMQRLADDVLPDFHEKGEKHV